MAGKSLPITTTAQDITHINGNPVTQDSIPDWVANHSQWSIFDDNDPDYYPSLICPNVVNNATFSVDGLLTSTAYGGATPVRRPRPSERKKACEKKG